MSSWIGCAVSVECGDALGSYQGTIEETDGSFITLGKAFKNGLPHPDSKVTIKASDIKDIKIIHTNEKGDGAARHSTVEVVKSAKKSHKFNITDSLRVANGKSDPVQVPPSPVTPAVNGSATAGPAPKLQGLVMYNGGKFPSSTNPASGQFKSKPIDIQGRQKVNGGTCLSSSTPNKKDNQRRKNEICFGIPSDDPIMTEEFDFEKNLALFDKQALWEELNQSQRPDIVRQLEFRRNPSQSKYRHDENVLEPKPVAHRCIIVPEHGRGPKEYVTDEGSIIPTLTEDFRNQLFAACGNAGLEGAELFARAGAEFALTLLGGTRRLHPLNNHQTPTVAFLIGPHRQGVVGVACARQLASHGVSTVVCVAPSDVRGALAPHLAAYRLTGDSVVTDVADLPSVDLVVSALLDGTERTTNPHASAVASWIARGRASVLALDPPPAGCPGVPARYSLLPILPLAHSPANGKLYLCNLAVPRKIFEERGVKYASPFGAKIVIPLHPND